VASAACAAASEPSASWQHVRMHSASPRIGAALRVVVARRRRCVSRNLRLRLLRPATESRLQHNRYVERLDVAETTVNERIRDTLTD
jgi:hypothetical protein